MFNVDIDIKGLEKLKHHIEFVNAMLGMKTDGSFQRFIKNKCIEAVDKVSNQRINMYYTSNDDLKAEYLRNNKVRDTDNGFIIYNDLSVVKPASHHSEGYVFCVALAFEYGTGLVGQSQMIKNAWEYNLNQNTVFYNGEKVDGWWLSKSKAGSVETFGESKSGNAIITRGYQGMEIYRYSAEEIKNNLKKWVLEFINKKEGEK